MVHNQEAIKERIAYLKHTTTILVVVTTTIFAGIMSLYYKNTIDGFMILGILIASILGVETIRNQVKIIKLLNILDKQ